LLQLHDFEFDFKFSLRRFYPTPVPHIGPTHNFSDRSFSVVGSPAWNSEQSAAYLRQGFSFYFGVHAA